MDGGMIEKLLGLGLAGLLIGMATSKSRERGSAQPVQATPVSDLQTAAQEPATMTETDRAALPRGIRNHNPGNIEYHASNNWQGQTGTDGRYAIFSAPVWGIRAMARLLNNYRKAGYDTIEKIINRWAPNDENNTVAYVASVAETSGIGPAATITDSQLPALIAAMINHENGQQPYSAALIAEGIAKV